MILVSTGTQVPFERLEKWITSFVTDSEDVIFASVGNLYTETELSALMLQARVIVAHAGIGTLLKTRELKRRLIVVPRLAKYGEQRNDHQLETCRFIKEYLLAEVAETKDELEYLLRQPDPHLYKQSALGLDPIALNLPSGKVLAISSFGGHTAELMHAMKDNVPSELKSISTGGDADYQISDFSRWNVWGACSVIGQLWRILRKEKPSLVISTGAAPGVVGILLARLMGIQSVWLDSVATRSQLSLSGRLVKPFCNCFYVQWPQLAKGKCRYVGNVLGN